ncbi:MAG: Asp-tRNA(Asn)/Glu-tRNA(Gln) amidotransferase subunit GatC [Candidatus Omnitrophica bacterium]|nr:Asp-tRNA(Asn)/Glu-tRNA(Gln) amidotransferase subunit GatC [Candidatus Omnitrophota bacterium]
MITKVTVKYIAGLSRIHLQDSELEKLTYELEGILDYIKNLEKLDVSKVTPTSHVQPIKNVFREDNVEDSLKQEDALGFAIAQSQGSFRVPQVIE